MMRMMIAMNSKVTTNSASIVTQENSMTGIKTTRRNYLFVIQKRTSKGWQMVRETTFTKRRFARECSNELNAASSVTGRGPNRLYRVVKMVIAS